MRACRPPLGASVAPAHVCVAGCTQTLFSPLTRSPARTFPAPQKNQIASRGGSAFVGVNWHKQKQKWRAKWMEDGKQKEKVCSSERAAAACYDRMIIRIYGL